MVVTRSIGTLLLLLLLLKCTYYCDAITSHDDDKCVNNVDIKMSMKLVLYENVSDYDSRQGCSVTGYWQSDPQLLSAQSPACAH